MYRQYPFSKQKQLEAEVKIKNTFNEESDFLDPCNSYKVSLKWQRWILAKT